MISNLFDQSDQINNKSCDRHVTKMASKQRSFRKLDFRWHRILLRLRLLLLLLLNRVMYFIGERERANLVVCSNGFSVCDGHHGTAHTERFYVITELEKGNVLHPRQPKSERHAFLVAVLKTGHAVQLKQQEQAGKRETELAEGNVSHPRQLLVCSAKARPTALPPCWIAPARQ